MSSTHNFTNPYFKPFVIGYCKKNESRKEAKHDKQYVNQYDKAL